ISPEAPVPVLESKSENLSLGGAANVANNLVALGCEVYLVGGIGRDEKGDKLLDLIKNRSIHTHGIYQFEHRPTTSKMRVIANNQQVLRIDKEDDRPITEETEGKFLKYLHAVIPEMDGVICSDYHKGILSEKISSAIMQRAKKSKKRVVVDPKGADFHKYNGATVITPNQKEVERVAPIKINSREDLDRAAEYILNLTHSEGILVTRGKAGMIFYSKKEKPFEISTVAKEVYDVTGAGDTVVAVLAAGIAAGQSPEDAAKLANLAAGLVVRKLGVASVSAGELRMALHRHGKGGRELVDRGSLETLVRDAQTRGERVVMTNGCFDILHAGHVAYLEEAKALGDRLVVAVNDDASVTRLKGAGRPINPLADRMSVLAGLAAVDWVAPFSEDTPAQLIEAVLPDVLVKGGDYRIEDIAGGQSVLANGGEVKVLPLMDGRSTSRIIESIRDQ
ncbi:MAG: bifunctional D-glycero-beta-D-manno-heptose-7-phosphate kinase/D-glycero-beta-D-manno-heptose 1-phosphate adenylyltransferase HldE, partial [Proteobacteria bacterium]|nr:bifunctional D-glycero-beta-D-manno-heptose-7-phosphate kinase/D-glycero-beta-D-manno-heptose 1-phosphate adenylyltransferase HldE [Pseudomonadota bacterium]